MRFPQSAKAPSTEVRQRHRPAAIAWATAATCLSDTSGTNVDSENHELHTADWRQSDTSAVVAATHVPIQGERGTFGAALFQTKLAALFHVRSGGRNRSRWLNPYYWDTNHPYLYLRFDAQRPTKLRDHRRRRLTRPARQRNTEARYRAPGRSTLETTFPTARLKHRWSGQVLETAGWLTLHWRGRARRQYPRHRIFWQWNDTGHVFRPCLIRDLITEKVQPVDRAVFAPNRKSGSRNLGLCPREQRFSYLFH